MDIVEEKAEAFASEIGTKEIRVLGKDIVYVTNIKDAQNKRKNGVIIIASAEREMIECKLIDMITNAEIIEPKDKTHRRGSGLNQVLAKEMAEKGKTYVFNLFILLSAKDKAKILGRMSANKKILTKYGVKMDVCSFAREPLDVRAERERKLFLENL